MEDKNLYFCQMDKRVYAVLDYNVCHVRPINFSSFENTQHVLYRQLESGQLHVMDHHEFFSVIPGTGIRRFVKLPCERKGPPEHPVQGRNQV